MPDLQLVPFSCITSQSTYGFWKSIHGEIFLEIFLFISNRIELIGHINIRCCVVPFIRNSRIGKSMETEVD
jgi:hypothetical protein